MSLIEHNELSKHAKSEGVIFDWLTFILNFNEFLSNAFSFILYVAVASEIDSLVCGNSMSKSVIEVLFLPALISNVRFLKSSPELSFSDSFSDSRTKNRL